MTLQQMHYFNEVCRLRNISLAAKELYISQPALSASLAELEKEVGVKLFMRKSRGIVPTEEGFLLRKYIRSILVRYDLLKQNLPEIAMNKKLIRVGFRPYAGENQYFSLTKRFLESYPELHFEANEMSNETPEVYLADDIIDFLITSKNYMPFDLAEKYQSLLVGNEEVKLYSNHQNPLSHIEQPSLEDLAQVSWVFWEGHRSFITAIQQIFASQGLELHIAAIMPQITGVLHFICNNLAVGFLTGSYVESIPIIKPISLPKIDGEPMLKPSVDIHMFWKKEIELYPNKRLFVEFVKEELNAEH